MPANDTLARRISHSPNWMHYKIIVAASFEKQQHKAELIGELVKKHIDSISHLEQKRLLCIYESMTEKQRKYTKNNDDDR